MVAFKKEKKSGGEENTSYEEHSDGSSDGTYGFILQFHILQPFAAPKIRSFQPDLSQTSVPVGAGRNLWLFRDLCDSASGT